MENKSFFSKSKWTVLILFGLIGQIAWSVENMYFNLFVFEEVDANLSAVTLMVQLSGIVATLITLFAGTLSDKLGNRRTVMSVGYTVWGVTVAFFGFLTPDLVGELFGLDSVRAVSATVALVVIGDCVMTAFGSSANDAAFNAWVTDNTTEHNRGRIEGIVAILPLVAMLIVAGGFGILASLLGYQLLFLLLGAVITVCGVLGFFIVRDSEDLKPSGRLSDIFYGFCPRAVKANPTFYLALVAVLIYGISTQIFMPYLIIYMKTYLGFTVIEYSAVFAIAILLGAAVNVYLTRLSDRMNKAKLLYFAVAVMALGLIGMYFSRGIGKSACLALFGIFGFVMIVGYIFISALAGSIVRDNTEQDSVGKLQGVRMVFSVLIPMVVGPMIGNAINSSLGRPISDPSNPDTMTTLYTPAPEIFLAASLFLLLSFIIIPFIVQSAKKRNEAQ